jgi:hypothetical protein
LKHQLSKDSLLIQKLLLIDSEFHFIVDNEKVFNQYNQPIKYRVDYSPVIKSWKVIITSGRIPKENIADAWAVVDEFGERLSEPKLLNHQFIRRLRKDPSGKCFFALVDSSGRLPDYELNNLINILQIEQGFIPIHACGVIHQQGLFLFGGKSGSGKSTIAALSSLNGNDILDEDQVVIRKPGPQQFYANAWGYSLKTSYVPIKAVFKVVQSINDALYPLTQVETAKFLFSRVMDVTQHASSKQFLVNIFSGMSEMARSIPGYELHFRKSPDFWKLIDREFQL